MRGRTVTAIAVGVLLFAQLSPLPVLAAEQSPGPGREAYEFYCYQCHGYAGDARTLASTYLTPPPRDFTRTAPANLSEQRMIDAVTHGRAGTAMVGFANVLSADEIRAVVTYVRGSFMGSMRSDRRYHSAENGWPDHERYRPAFPFVTGALSLSTDVRTLDPAQRAGRQLYLDACISCHDHGTGADGPLMFEPRAVSFPRNPPITQVDTVSSASPYLRHERAPAMTGVSSQARAGEMIFQNNCAFCHARDGTGRNWIGSFLEPRPRNLTQLTGLTAMDRVSLRGAIENGIPGSSMPAWKHVLSDTAVDALMAYIEEVLILEAVGGSQESLADATSRQSSVFAPGWRRNVPQDAKRQ